MREPAAIIAAIGAFLASLVKVAQLLGLVTWTGDQVAGIALVTDNFLALMGLILVRQLVTPMASPRLPEGRLVNDGDSVVLPAAPLDRAPTRTR